MITIKEIADLAGVSRGTVDRVVNNRGRVNEKVKKRILDVIEETGYVQKKRIRRKAYRIGVVTQLCNASFMENINKGLDEAALLIQSLDSSLIIKSLEGVDGELQVRAIEELESEGMDALAIMPVDCEVVRNKINELIERKIPVVTFNTDIIGTKRNTFIGMDNKQSGRVGAELMNLLMHGEGKVLVITGHFGNRTNNLRVEGFHEEIQRACPNIQVVGVQSSFDKSDEVKRIISETMTLHPDLGGIFLASAGQGGVHPALAKNLGKRPFVIVYDVTKNNRKRIMSGDFDFIIDQDTHQQSYIAIKLLYDYLRDNKVVSDMYNTGIQLKSRGTLE